MAKNDTKRQVEKKMQCVTEIDVGDTNGGRIPCKNRKIIKNYSDRGG
jgi:hypothetical protein